MAATVTGKALPGTAAEVAAAVLDGIQNYPNAFDMDTWVGLRDIGQLGPEAEPICGTTMCAAGWVAHVTGWTLIDALYENDETDQLVLITYSDGVTCFEFRHVYASKDGINRPITDVAREALSLTHDETFWYDDVRTALIRLHQIAERDRDHCEPDMDAGTGHGAYEYR
ncbi:hypothetical protein [Streptomyces sp. STR69]|uniref:hypothetical protein n=1 Tax=Streptomyces sp. STR69 TaxID=1796942 RepID=UPI0021C92D38|nr:hypothetical protein [Streptomyces sp. STR69]